MATAGTMLSPTSLDSAQHEGAWNWTTAEEQPHHWYILRSIDALFPDGSDLSVLDAGCGNGFIAARIAGRGHNVIAIDASTTGVELARVAHPGVRYEVKSVYGDLGDLMPRGGWDLIISSEVIEHLSKPSVFLANMNRHLRPGGWLILTTPYHGYLKNLALSIANAWDHHHGSLDEGGHIKFFSQHTLATALVCAGFEPPVFRNAGRVSLFWKSMVCRSRKPGPQRMA